MSLLVCWFCRNEYPDDHEPVCPDCGKPLVKARFV